MIYFYPQNHKTSANQGAEKVEENSLIYLSSILAYKVLTCKACVGEEGGFVAMFRLYLHTHKELFGCLVRSHNLTNARHKSTANKVWSPISLVLYFSPPALLHSLGSPSIPSSLHLPFWTRDEAEMEYLKIAQDLDMYGVNYFLIRVSPCCFSTVYSVYQ